MATETFDSLEPAEAVVILHPAWVERVPVETLARVLLGWGRWLDVGMDRTGATRFYARPATLLTLVPGIAGRG